MGAVDRRLAVHGSAIDGAEEGKERLGRKESGGRERGRLTGGASGAVREERAKRV